MAIDKIKVGVRIRNIREINFKETREIFAERLNVSTGYLGKIERGEILISLKLLEKITKIAGVSADYILFENKKEKLSYVRRNINFILDSCTEDELKVYFKVIMTIQGYVLKITDT